MTGGPATDEATEPYRRRIAEIWSAALGTPVTDAGHHFFAGGGDSFQAALATATVRREWGLEITVQLLIDHPVLGDFSERVARFVDER
ncbi:phosphopantetheine-binding protein [Streptomyces sp. NPDC052309]|uniref:phosphopantetheine-binding protein n=1 Tax=Streptomyces sp. NPDC052309 TaxID=3155421 RepID=UPI003432E8EC